LLTAIFATIVAPLLVLGLDYVYRANTSMNDLVLKAGPDLCLVSLGASVPVFLDARVIHAIGNRPGLEVGAILGIILARGLCLRFNGQLPNVSFKYAGMACDIACILFVGGIMIFGYWNAGGG
jgi:hypothetical protein